MSKQGEALPLIWPDLENLVTEDDEPVDNWVSERHMRLWVDTLYISYNPGKPFIAAANVGIFYDPKEQPIVPDMFLSLGVQPHKNWWKKQHRCYFLSEFGGKVPELALELVSNREGGENDTKKGTYEKIGVKYYVIFDPDHALDRVKKETLICYELRKKKYVRVKKPVFPDLGLQLVLWEGENEGRYDTWLRWADLEENLLPTGSEEKERADAAAKRAEEENQRAEEEAKRAAKEAQRAEEENQRAEEEAKRAAKEAKRAEEEAKRAEEEAKRAETASQEAERLRELLKQAGIDPESGESQK